MSNRHPITLVRTALQMTATVSMQTIARQVRTSKSVIVKWKQQYRESGHTLSDLSTLSDLDLAEIVFAPRTPNGFKPWRSDEELFEWFCSTKLKVKHFYKTVYLPSVPEGHKPVQLPYVYRHIQAERKKHPEVVETTGTSNTVECFDISDEVAPAESAPLYRNQVRITLANGASIDFYPGSASEAFVGELLRQNGVKI